MTNVCIRDGQSSLVVFGEKGDAAVVTLDTNGGLTVGIRQPVRKESVVKLITIPKCLEQLILGMATLSRSLNEYPQIEEIKRELGEVQKIS